MLRAAALVLLGLLLAQPGTAEPAQIDNQGTVLDLQGNPLPNVIIEIESAEDRPERLTPKKTDADGSFTWKGRIGVRYRVRAILNDVEAVQIVTPSSDPNFANRVTLTIVDGKDLDPAWNMWAEDAATRQNVDSLTVGQSYVLHFDLAGFSYSRFTGGQTPSSPVNPKVKELLEKRLAITLVVKPEMRGAGLAFEEPDEARTRRLEINNKSQFDKLLEPETLLSEMSEEERKDLKTLSDELGVAKFQIRVLAQRPGIAAVGVTIWDANSKQLLDSITYRATISALPSPAGGGGTASRAQAQEGSASELQEEAGLDSLLASPGAPPADAGLFVYEFDSVTQDPPPNRVVLFGPGDQIRSWEPRRSIREFIHDGAAMSLARQLERIHCPSTGDCPCGENYSQVAKFFAGALFSDPTEEGRKLAREARKDLESLVGCTRTRTVATGYVDTSGTAVPLPLGLLGLSDGRLLGEAAFVTQRLAQTRPVDPNTSCIKLFTTILPRSLGLGEGCDCERLDGFLIPEETPAHRYLTELDDLRDYFTSSKAETGPEGFLLLSHHADGFLSFEPRFSDALLAEDITKKYELGSAAILISCTVGGLTPLNRSLPLVSTLNENGIDAMIYSPFTVNATLGSRLAVKFSAEIEAVRRKGLPITLQELYRRVLEQMQTDPAAEPFRRELSEFSLAGNGNLNLCLDPPAVPPTPLPEREPDPQCRCSFFSRLMAPRTVTTTLEGTPGSSSQNGPKSSAAAGPDTSLACITRP